MFTAIKDIRDYDYDINSRQRSLVSSSYWAWAKPTDMRANQRKLQPKDDMLLEMIFIHRLKPSAWPGELSYATSRSEQASSEGSVAPCGISKYFPTWWYLLNTQIRAITTCYCRRVPVRRERGGRGGVVQSIILLQNNWLELAVKSTSNNGFESKSYKYKQCWG